MVYLIFFLSGVSALIYQVAWMKVLTVEFGSTVYAVSTVLSVFMTGLALGSWLFGRKVDTVRRPLVLYAVMEAAIGGYAIVFLLSLPLVHRIYVAIERSLHPSYEWFSVIKLVFAFVLLILPTTLMGGTLPVLSKHLGLRRRGRARRLARLYSCNTLGAMVGSVGFAFGTILVFGVTGSILLSAAINACLALASFWLARSPHPVDRDELVDTSDWRPAHAAEPRNLRRLAVVVAFVSGFVILACEVLWTRLFITFLSGNALVFATILTAVLAGLAVGGFVASWGVGRFDDIGPLLAAVQVASAALLVAVVVLQPQIGALFSSAYKAGGPMRPFLTLFLLLALPCTVLGITFPALIKWVARGAGTIGTDIGTLYSVNTIGAVLGSLASGFLLIELLGVNTTLLVMAALFCAVGAGLYRTAPPRGGAAVAALACIALAVVPTLRQPRYWYNGGFQQLDEIPAENTEFLEEGVSATVGVARFDQVRNLTVNGLIVAQTTEHDLWDLQSKAHLPMLIHPSPRRVALVGLGAGVSLGATAAYDVDTLDCIELSPEVVRACRRFEDINQRCLDDPRLNLIVNDGRHFLMTTNQRYDVISVDPIDPPVCTLYSQDFFQVCHDRLDDGGLMVQWVPVFRLSPDNTKVVINAFVTVFPNSTLWYNGTAVLLIGSKGEALEVDGNRLLERAREPSVQQSLRLIGSPNPVMFLTMFIGDTSGFDEIFPEPISPNTDDRPTLEYTVLRSREAMQAKEYWTLKLLPRFASRLEDRLNGPLAPPNQAQFVRMREITNAYYGARLLMFEGKRQQAEALVHSAARRHRISQQEAACLMHFFGFRDENG
jgi:spermidine synthase